ncbi:3-ketosteroid-9-alpha-hydroxylase reductase subunit [Mycobacteroides abscessus MAB_091912_2446]|uniref:3-ketosteroid-9-alpha-hydroxylase reductase subunit n=1 Tax=Mycobacteroides abscessus MAB_091912_2446 TaxID=1335414 RepID=A0A829MMV0_9MYCO|nr:3-ketosteroid-9-alpha-hydroxylase reductase subunit [Mycobacteroides abscessus MAB_091912_2446]
MTGNPHVHSLKVVEIIRETGDAVSLVFEVPDALVDAFRYRPGQFLTLKIPSEQTGSVARCYSLSSSPHLDDDLVVTVKRTDGGYASNWLCDNVGVGDHITVLTPSGVFVPRSLDSDFLLIAAGSGITPMLSIAKSVLLGGAGTVYLFYANRDAQSVIFGPRSTTSWWSSRIGCGWCTGWRPSVVCLPATPCPSCLRPTRGTARTCADRRPSWTRRVPRCRLWGCPPITFISSTTSRCPAIRSRTS